MPAKDSLTTRPKPGAAWRRLRRFAPLVVAAALTALVLAMGWHRELSLETLVRYRNVLDGFIAEHYWTSIAAFIALYVTVVALSIPGSLYLTITSGILFGTVVGGLASLIGATAGACAIFLIARTAFGEHLARRAGPMAARLAEGFREDTFSYLLFLRLVPFPFFVVNLVAAIAGVRLVPFVIATAIGIVPAVFILSFVGSGLDSIVMAQEATYRACLAAGGANCTLDFRLDHAITPQMVGALVALGVFALIPVAVKRLRARRLANSSNSG